MLLLLSLSGCSSLGFLPAASVATLNHPTHVEAYRIGSLADHPGYGGKMDGYAVFDTGHAPPDAAKDLASAIADPNTYRDAVRPDDFTPVIGYRFYRLLPYGRGQASLDVLIDLDSDELMLVAHDGRLREVYRRLMESDPARQRLLQISRQTFPFDELIQSTSDYRLPSTQPDE
jgi:hypothetical protein